MNEGAADETGKTRKQRDRSKCKQRFYGNKCTSFNLLN